MSEQEGVPLHEPDGGKALDYKAQILQLRTHDVLTPDKIDNDELLEIYEKRHDPNGPSEQVKELVKKYTGITYDRNDRASEEMRNELKIVTEGLFDMPASQHTFGKFAPAYVPELVSYAHQHEGQHHRALMVGALTPKTTREYVATMQQTLGPSTESHVIDLAGERTAAMDLPNYAFHQGDFLDNDLLSGQFSVIATNFLMGFLVGPYPRDERRQKVGQFIAESHRLLAPGGRLIMVENMSEKHPMNPMDLRRPFEKAGFTIRAEPAVSFEKRRDIDRYYQDPGEDFSGARISHVRARELILVAEKKEESQWFRRLMRRG